MPVTFSTLAVEYLFAHRFAKVTLKRAEVHNAFNALMIEELARAFQLLARDPQLHGVLLEGEGPSFCAGADVNWMRESATLREEENLSDAHRLASMLRSIEQCPVPVIARVQKFALGGGAGLVAASDIVVAEESARFAFSEVKLGIVPAVISPFVLRKIGTTAARRYFVTGERFDARRAFAIGLIQEVVPLEKLDEQVESIIQQLLSSAPQAVRVSKQLALTVGTLSPDAALELTTSTIARIRVTPEGQEGLSAFLEKRKPNWIQQES